MQNDIYLSIVIPAYNEEYRLPFSLNTIINYLDKKSFPYEIIIVDDGSQDRTVEIIQNLIKDHKNINILRNIIKIWGKVFL